jgi:L,D-peptidoglycan transpeptidase YkuD (ErfK/YbiS/YcfS/YnhG family)
MGNRSGQKKRSISRWRVKRMHGPVRQISVYLRSVSRSHGILRAGHLIMPCVIGRTGLMAKKREGDGATPRGQWPIRQAFFRADRLAVRPSTRLRLTAISRRDGWCDAPSDRNYNRPVRHPYSASAERLWREDGLYDIVIVVGHNDLPRARGGGSAIFIHVAGQGPHAMLPTEGCVALGLADLKRLLALIDSHTRLSVGVR